MTAACQATLSGVVFVPGWVAVHWHYCDDVLGANLHAVAIAITRQITQGLTHAASVY